MSEAIVREIAQQVVREQPLQNWMFYIVLPALLIRNVHFKLSYFADNSITRIASCRDKLALMVWAFYYPFNPEKRPEMLDYTSVLDRLKHPLRFGLSFKNHQGLVSYLDMLHGQDFDRMVNYRHLKIHRMEPRIEIYG
jgi:hypothetical protein